MSHDPWKLDPAQFPRRLELELTDAVLGRLEQLSARTGRPVRDLAADLLAQAASDMEQHQA